MKPLLTPLFSAACERNAAPILQVLAPLLKDCATVLEIGSGTGQHAVYFGARLPHLTWQCSDLPHNHASILAWQRDAGLANVLPPLTLALGQGDEQDDGQDGWPHAAFDALFTANTCHIMAESAVEALFAGAPAMLRAGGLLCIYGPFNYGGQFTSAGNAQFDAALRSQASHMGLRDSETMIALAIQAGLLLQADITMPSNNRMLVFRRP